MVGITCIALGYILAAIHLAVRGRCPTRSEVVEVLLTYSLVFQVGVIGFVFGFIPHVFFADATAKAIGWAPGSPFQFEVGIHDGAWGVLGFLCLWFKGGFRVATGLGWALFMLGAALGHLYQTFAQGDFAEYNFLMIFVD